MKNKKPKNLKKRILSGLAGIILLSGCSTIKPTGSIDIAYVPERVDDKEITNEMMVELDLGLKIEIKDVGIIIGGRQRTYMYPFRKKTIWFKPNRQEYDIYGKVKYKNLEFYAEHMCSHPVDKRRETVKDSYGNPRILGYDDITKIGVKLEF